MNRSYNANVLVTRIKNGKLQYLAVTRRNDRSQFTMPGGTLKRNERFQDCVKRELEEETGLIINLDDLEELYTCHNLIVYDKIWTCTTFLIHSWEGNPYARERGTIVRWLPMEYYVKNCPPTWRSHEENVYKTYIERYGLPLQRSRFISPDINISLNRFE